MRSSFTNDSRGVPPTIGKLLLVGIVLIIGTTATLTALQFTDEVPEEDDEKEIVTKYLEDLELLCDGDLVREGDNITSCDGNITYASPDGLMWMGDPTTIRILGKGTVVEFKLEEGDKRVMVGSAIPDEGEVKRIQENNEEDFVVIEIK